MSTRLAFLGPNADALPSDWPAPHDQPTSAVEEVDWDMQMRRHERKVLVALLARGVALERAKELAQEAWIRVMQNHRNGKLDDLQIPGVVIAQARFLARDDHRRCGRRSGCGMDASTGIDPDASPAPADLEARLAARQQLRKVREILEDAPENVRRVFSMTYGSDVYSAGEIAEILGLSVQRVRQITYELRRRIRREIGGRSP